jgi:hypothetical protein
MSRPAHVADGRMVRHQLPQAAGQLGSAQAGVGHQALVADRLEHRDAGGTGHGVAAVRGAVRAAPPARLDVPARHDRGQRQAIGDGLGDAHHVRDDARVLECPHLAGAAEA